MQRIMSASWKCDQVKAKWVKIKQMDHRRKPQGLGYKGADPLHRDVDCSWLPISQGLNTELCAWPAVNGKVCARAATGNVGGPDRIPHMEMPTVGSALPGGIP